MLYYSIKLSRCLGGFLLIISGGRYNQNQNGFRAVKLADAGNENDQHILTKHCIFLYFKYTRPFIYKSAQWGRDQDSLH